MQYQGHTALRRLLVMLTLALVVLVAGGQPTFAEGLDEKDAALTLSPDMQTQDISQRNPDMQAQEEKAKAKDVKGAVSTQGYDWSDDAVDGSANAKDAKGQVSTQGYDWSDDALDPNANAKDAKGSISTQGYDWSDD